MARRLCLQAPKWYVAQAPKACVGKRPLQRMAQEDRLRSVSVRRNEPVPDREQRELEAARDAGLVEDAGEMVFDRLEADASPVRDIPVAVAGNDGGDNFDLSGRQAVLARRLNAELPHRLGEVVDDTCAQDVPCPP